MLKANKGHSRTRGLSIATRIFLSFASIVAAFSIASAFTLYRMGSLRESVTVLWKELVPTTNQLRVLSRQIKSVEEFLSFRRPTDAQWLGQVLPGLEPFDGQYGMGEAGRRLLDLTASGAIASPERELIEATGRSLSDFSQGPELASSLAGAALSALEAVSPNLESTNDGVFRALVLRVLELVQAGDIGTDSPETLAMVKVLRRINRELNESVRALGGPVRQLDLRIEEEQRTSTLIAILIALGAVVISIALLWLVQRTLRPIRHLRDGARRIAAGDYAERVDIQLSDEIGGLADEFNTMAESLQARDQELEIKHNELLRSERLAAIGRVAAQITHEIRNPLSSIGLNAELLEDEIAALPDPTAASEILGAIAREVERLKGITEDYLQFARVPRSELVSMDLWAVLRDLLVFLEPEARLLQIALVAPPNGPAAQAQTCIEADPQQVRQALMNVFRNAFEALKTKDEPRTVRVSMRPADAGWLEVTVADDGPGIAPEIKARLFEPFVSDKSRGTGLGLALTRDIMVAHGGEIRIDSSGVAGEGTSVLLRWRRSPVDVA